MATPTLRFDDQLLLSELEGLAPRLRAVFAASCAERLMFPYVASTIRSGRGPATELRRILTRLWEDLSFDGMKRHEISGNIDRCLRLIGEPALAEGGSQVLEDAGVAVTHALQCRLDGAPHESLSAARCAYEELIDFVSQKMGIDPSAPGAEDQVAQQGIVQTELARQKRDVEELKAAPSPDAWELVESVRARAQRESRSLFDAPIIIPLIPQVEVAHAATRSEPLRAEAPPTPATTLEWKPGANLVTEELTASTDAETVPPSGERERQVVQPQRRDAGGKPAPKRAQRGVAIAPVAEARLRTISSVASPEAARRPAVTSPPKAGARSAEELLKALATELGLARAISILEGERGKFRGILRA